MPRVRSSADQVTGAMLATPLLKGVPAKAVQRLSDAGRVRNFRKGSYLCHQGDEADEIYFLIEGRVEISSISVTGSRVLHASVDMPQFVGELGVLAEIDRTASVLTLEDSVVWIAAADDFLGFLAGEPAAAVASSGSSRARCTRTRPSSTTCCSWISKGESRSVFFRWQHPPSTISLPTEPRSRA